MSGKRRRPRLSLDLLKGFEAAARHLSFTQAAQDLSLTQSAISREIKTLEDQLGEPLFTRINRGLRLTDAGQVLYRAVSEALALIDEATDRLAASKGGEMLTVTTSAPLASMWLVPKLQRFVRLHPEVDMRSVAAAESVDLERERFDVAIRWAPPGSNVAGGEPLFNMTIFPICSPTLARDPLRPLKSPTDLTNHVLLDYEILTAHGPWSDWGTWLDAMKLQDLKPAGTLRFSHYDQVIQAAIDGSGVAIGRNAHNARHLREGLLVAPFGREAKLSWERISSSSRRALPNAKSLESLSHGCTMKFAKMPQRKPSERDWVGAGRSGGRHSTRARESLHPIRAKSDVRLWPKADIGRNPARQNRLICARSWHTAIAAPPAPDGD